jgi:dipeptidyl aminopeptidase/acylaminoacyl peptidase
MQRDLTKTPRYREVEEHFRQALGPAFGRISGATDADPAPDGGRIAFTGSRFDALEGKPITRICVASVAGQGFEEVTGGPNNDRLPRWSPDGARLAFLSDRAEKGKDQLFLLHADRVGEAVAAPQVPGTIEYLSWSPDGSLILLGVAEEGAELSGAQGSGRAAAASEDFPSWAPEVRGPELEGWRRAWVFDLAAGEVRPASREGLNVWEAVWCGPGQVAAVVSDSPGEDAWYSAPLAVIDVESGKERIVLHGDDQLGWPAGSPDGSRVAVVRAVCSDRWIVAGDLLLVDPESGDVMPVDTGGVDVTGLAWRDADTLFFIGLRGLDSVAGDVDARTGRATERWTSPEGAGLWYPAGTPLRDRGFVVVAESYDRPQRVVVVRDGTETSVVSFEHDGTEYLRRVGGRMERVDWPAADGTRIDALLLRPHGDPPYPLVVSVHGGPVWAYQDRWNLRASTHPILASHGYAVLLANPRGSGGRGQDFARQVYGDMGGGDAGDILAGIEALIERGLVDPERVGVMGGSYGGFMTAWLVTQTDRFAAAVAVSPVTDWYSQHYSSNLSHWDRIILADDQATAGGQFFQRSPLMHVRQARTPTLLTAGLQDRCTPPGQAVEFHQALLEHGVESELALYPEEGHGVRNLPAIVDFCTRVLDWFERHMPAGTT